MANVIKFACKYCGQEVNIPAPSKAGLYSITCPHCSKQMRVQYTPKPIRMGSAPKVSSPPSPIDTEKARHTPTRRFNTSEELLKNASAQVQRPSSSIGRLSMVRLGCDKKYFPLQLGENMVGRKDSTCPSDIEIDGDETMSRRSVLITVSKGSGGYDYMLTVLKTYNPVLVNGQSLTVGQTVRMSIGTSLYMGQTMLRLEN